MVKKYLGARDISIVDGVAYSSWPLTFWQRVFMFLNGKVYVEVRGYGVDSDKPGHINFKLTMIPPEGG